MLLPDRSGPQVPGTGEGVIASTRTPFDGIDFDALGEGIAPKVRWRPVRRLLRPVARALRHAGLLPFRRALDVPPVDLRGRDLHPEEALRLADGRSFVIDVPLGRLRIWYGFRPHRAAGAPMVEVAHRLVEGRPAAATRLPYETFFERWRPRTRADTFAIGAPDAGPALLALPSWVPVMPWSEHDPLKMATRMARLYREESVEHGGPGGVRHGHPGGGPWSAERVAAEVRRLGAVIASVRGAGFQPDAWITGTVLLGSDNDWALTVISGQHRTGSAEALGLTELPVLFQDAQLARRDEVGAWRPVRDGLFTPHQALRVFDRVLAGEPPPGCPHPGSPDRLGWQADRGNVSGQGS